MLKPQASHDPGVIQKSLPHGDLGDQAMRLKNLCDNLRSRKGFEKPRIWISRSSSDEP